MPPHRFQKGNKEGAKHGPTPGSGRHSELHRAECRKLLEDGKLNAWVQSFATGKPEDIYVTQFGSVKKIPASAINRLRAVQYLAEQGHTKADASSVLSADRIKLFEATLLSLFQKYVPASARSAKLVEEVLGLMKLLEPPSEDEE
ncbi:hypothetical protein KW797_02545 [Candidatus Parcubacteria bacterium]|nr:hypothetical protein [Candidatus Parcubacteria bacterium]